MLPPDARTRLSQLLGMTDSAHDGEALNAVRLANALLQKHRLTWAEIIPEPLPPEPACSGFSVPDHHQEAEAILAAHRARLTLYESEFLVGILAFQTLTSKQRGILDGIRRKVRLAA